MSATVCSRHTVGYAERNRMGVDGWVGKKESVRDSMRCDEAWRKKTVNEAFLEARGDYPPKKKKSSRPFSSQMASPESLSDLEGFV